MLHNRLLTYLDCVARMGSIRRAADHLNVAASAISRQIKDLEDAIGTPLFHRLPRKLVLTAAGEVVIRHVRDTLKDQDRSLQELEAMKGLQRGEVTVAMMSGLAANLVSAGAAAFLARHPRVKLKLQLHPVGDTIISSVAGLDADLGVGFDFPADPRLRVVHRAQGRLGAVMAPTHPLAARGSVRLADCATHPLVVSDRTMAIRPYLENAFARQSLQLVASVETNSIEVMRRIARQPGFITFLTRFDIAVDLEEGHLVYAPCVELGRDPQSLMVVSHHRGSGALASVLAEFLARNLGAGDG